MKRNVISLLLAVVMVFAITAVVTLTAEPVAAATDHTSTHCWCDGASVYPEGHSAECTQTISWQSHGSTALATNVVFSEEKNAIFLNRETAGSVDFSGAPEGDYYLCLNGNIFRGNAPITVPEGYTLTICNCGAENGYVGSTKTSNGSAGITVSGGTVNLINAKVTGSYNTNTNRCVTVTAGTFNMYGGKLVDGVIATSSSGGSAEIKTNYGGIVYISGGEFNFLGGLIGFENQRTSDNAYQGGCVYMNGGVFNMGVEGGGDEAPVMQHGRSNNLGGNVLVNSGTFNMFSGYMFRGYSANGGNVRINANGTFNLKGGRVNNGFATKNGGNFSVNAGDLTITGGRVTNGHSSNTTAGIGANLILIGAADFKATGGEIGDKNTVTAYAKSVEFNSGFSGTFTVGGNAKITNVVMANGKPLEIDSTYPLTGDAMITVTATVGEVFANTTNKSNKSYFGSYAGTETVAMNDEGTGLVLATGHTHCWCAGAEVRPANHVCANSTVWTPHTDVVDGTKITFTEENTYVYLDSNVAGSLVFPTNLTEATEFYLCLNGNRLSGSSPVNLTDYPNVVLTICDCDEGGEIRCTKATSGVGDGNMITVAGRTVKLMSGTLNGIHPSNSHISNRMVYVDSGTFEMYGGTIENGFRYGSYNGGNVNMGGGTFNMYAGTIRNGGYQDYTTTVEEVETPVHNIMSLGGNVYVGGGNFNMYGGTISGGEAGNGGSIRVQGGTFTMGDTNVTGNPQVIGGTANTNGGAVSVAANGTFTMNNGTVSGGHATNGGNFAVVHANASLTINAGCTVENGTADELGGNIYLTNGTVTVNGTVKNGSSGGEGENIFAKSAGTAVLNIAGTVTAKTGKNDSINTRVQQTSATSTTQINIQNGAVITGGGMAVSTQRTGVTLNVAGTVNIAGENVDINTSSKIILGTDFENAKEEPIRVKGYTQDVFVQGGAAYKDEFANASTDYYIYSEGDDLCLSNDVAAITGDAGYGSVADALAASNGKAVKLRKDCAEDLTLTNNVVIDLNGYDITNAITDSGYTLSIYDYANYQYDADACGSYAGDNAEKYVVVDQAVSDAGTLRRYIALENEDGTWSFHRVYVTISAVSINPTADVTSLNYSTVFIGDQAVADYINSNNGEYGLKAVIDGYQPIEKAYEEGSFKACTTDLVNNTTYFTEKQTAISNIMKSDAVDPSNLSDLNNSQRAALKVQATAYIKLTIDGEEITVESSNQAATARSFQGMVNTAAAAWDSLLPAQKTALWSLKETFGSELTTDNGWVVDKIVDPEETV